jgi:hypothetical protein
MQRESYAAPVKRLLGVALGGAAEQGELWDAFFPPATDTEVGEQLGLVRELRDVVARYTRVRVYLSARGWSARLLQRMLMFASQNGPALTQEVATIAALLAAFSTTVKEVRLLLRLLKGTSSDARPPWWCAVLEILRRAADGVLASVATVQSASAAVGTPLVYFDFSGVNSGLMLPAFAKLPSGGMTAALWLRCESFVRVQDASVDRASAALYEPCVLSLLDEAGAGLCIKFAQNFLLVETHSGGGKLPSRAKSTVPFQTHRWHCVVVSFDYHMVGRDECFVYIDGLLREHFHLPYPKNCGALRCSAVGACLDRTPKRAVMPANSFIGQVATVLLVEDVVPESVAKALHSLPILSWSNPAAVRQVCPKTFAAYDARATEGVLCLETINGQRKFYATKLEGTVEIRQCDVTDAILCSGGPHILIPLLAQLDLPVRGAEAEQAAFAWLKEVSSSRNLCHILELLGAALRHPLAEREMLQHHGFAMLGHVLRFVSPVAWDTASFAALEMVASCTVQSERMHRGFFVNVYLNFRIWIYAPTQVCVYVFVCGVFFP